MSTDRLPLVPGTRAGYAWAREDWVAYADRLLAAVQPWASPGGSQICLPGQPGGYGADIDGLEGFTRTFLLAGFRIAGARGEGVDDLIAFYTRGIKNGVDPDASDRWVRLDEHPQAKVEAASLALILDMTRPWIWERLDEVTQNRVIDYLSPIVGDASYPKNNWLWFRVVVQTFLRSVGGPWSPADIASDLAAHDSYYRTAGWYSDGTERAFDHYVGWAMHLYPALWARMQGASELAAGREAKDKERLERFLQDAVNLIGGDGSPLIQGRSLVYRFAAAASYWAGAFSEVETVPLGQLRRAAEMIVTHFAERGVPDENDLLTLGWFGTWRRLAQNYSGTGSPYWAVKGLIGIALPADHPVWHAPAEPLPIEKHDVCLAIEAPGWVVAGTTADGIIRVVNHGTDHALEGDLVGDSPIYARTAYSTSTAPLHDGRAWAEPLEQSVVLVRDDGSASHRAGMRLLGTAALGEIGVAGSRITAHFIAPSQTQTRHGSGIVGDVSLAGTITVWSLTRGAWEVRFARVEELADASTHTLRIGGWPVAGEHLDISAGSIRNESIESHLVALGAEGTFSAERRDGASPLALNVAVPVLRFPVVVGEWFATAIALRGVETSAVEAPSLEHIQSGFSITWQDGTRTRALPTDHRIVVDGESVEPDPASTGPLAIAKEQLT